MSIFVGFDAAILNFSRIQCFLLVWKIVTAITKLINASLGSETYKKMAFNIIILKGLRD